MNSFDLVKYSWSILMSVDHNEKKIEMLSNFFDIAKYLNTVGVDMLLKNRPILKHSYEIPEDDYVKLFDFINWIRIQKCQKE